MYVYFTALRCKYKNNKEHYLALNINRNFIEFQFKMHGQNLTRSFSPQVSKAFQIVHYDLAFLGIVH